VSVTFSLAEFQETDQFGTVLCHLDSDLNVNVSNANARALLDRLGIEAGDLFGETTPEDLLGRALVGNVGRDDGGVDAVETPGEWFGGGATMIDCGIRPGYFEDRMAALVALATHARDHDLMIGWA
jgi:hypothetical protein